MKLPSWLKISKPTKTQAEHDLYLTAVAFLTAFLAVWQVQPDKFSKAAVIAATVAGLAAVLTTVKSILTTL